MLGSKTDNAINDGVGNLQIGHNTGTVVHGLTFDQHQRAVSKERADLRSELEARFAETQRADAAEIELLNMQIAELGKRQADPLAAYAAYQMLDAKLKDLLLEMTNASAKIGENRISDAKAAADQGDYRAADAIFAEVQEIENAAVIRSAEAAFGRGVIAEQEIRWQDAASHYAAAARLVQTFDTLDKGQRFSRRAGNYATALRIGGELCEFCKTNDQLDDLGSALSEYASTLLELGEYSDATAKLNEALEIAQKTQGSNSSGFVAILTNLAITESKLGLYTESEEHFKQALSVTEQNTKKSSADLFSHALLLNGLSQLVLAQGRYADAEAQCNIAVNLLRDNVGELHPVELCPKVGDGVIRRPFEVA